MKRTLIWFLCLAIAACMSLTACGDVFEDNTSGSSGSGTSSDSTDSGNTGDSSGSLLTDVFVSSVQLPAGITEFNVNSAEKDDETNEFFQLGKSYKVGTMNGFTFKPYVLYMDSEGDSVDAPADEGTYSYKVEKKEGEDYTDGAAYVEDFDETTCTVDFTDEAQGGTFRLSAWPNALTANQQTHVEDYTVSFEVEVIDGYNAYKPYELAVVCNFTERDLPDDHDSKAMHAAWPAFRAEHGLPDPDSVHAFIFHSDMLLTADDIVDTMFYSEEEAKELKDGKFKVGSLKDGLGTAIYHRDIGKDEEFAIYGNYFTLDLNKLPVVLEICHGVNEYIGQEATFDEEGNLIENHIISHASLFRFDSRNKDNNAKAKVEDIALVGNSPKDGGLAGQGGVIFFKSDTVDMLANNIVSRRFFITTMASGRYGSVEFKNMKCYDSLNAPIYNWGNEDMKLDNCIIKDSGGPAIIADAYMDGGDAVGPKVVATNCVFDNPVAGNEVWFTEMAKASAIVEGFKALNAVPQGISLKASQAAGATFNRGFLKTYGEEGSGTQAMNIIIVVKDDGADVWKAGKMAPYIEINGAVLDYGKAFRTAETDGLEYKSNGAAYGEDAATYRTALAGILNDACGKGAPVLETSGGGICAYLGGENIQFVDNSLQGQLRMLQGDYINIYYNTGDTNGVIGVMCEYFDLTK